MNKRFTKAVAATLAAMSIANVAVFADDAPVVEEAPSKITVDVEKIKEDSKILYTFGDINLDGEMTNADLLLCAKAVVGAEKLEGYNFIIADIEKDGVISNSDLVILSRALVGLDYKLERDYTDRINKTPEDLEYYFRDPETKIINDYKPGVVFVYMADEVYVDYWKGNIDLAHIQMLFPNIEIENVALDTGIHSFVRFELKEKTKEAVVDAIYKLMYNPYAKQALA